MLLQFRTEMGYVLRRVPPLTFLICGVDRLFTGVSRHIEDRVRIERMFRLDDGCVAPLTALFLLFLSLPRLFVLLTRVVLLANTSGLFFTRPLTALFLFARLLPMLFFGLSLRQLLIRPGLPQRLSRLVPTRGTQIASLGHVGTAHPACTGDASTLDGQKGATDPGHQRDDADADPQRRKRRRRVARRARRTGGGSVVRRGHRRFRLVRTGGLAISDGSKLKGETLQIGLASLGRSRRAAGRVERLPVCDRHAAQIATEISAQRAQPRAEALLIGVGAGDARRAGRGTRVR